MAKMLIESVKNQSLIVSIGLAMESFRYAMGGRDLSDHPWSLRGTGSKELLIT